VAPGDPLRNRVHARNISCHRHLSTSGYEVAWPRPFRDCRDGKGPLLRSHLGQKPPSEPRQRSQVIEMGRPAFVGLEPGGELHRIGMSVEQLIDEPGWRRQVVTALLAITAIHTHTPAGPVVRR
jgi:hypothetical protein